MSPYSNQTADIISQVQIAIILCVIILDLVGISLGINLQELSSILLLILLNK